MTPLISRLETLAQDTGIDIIKLWDEFVAFIHNKIEEKKVVPHAPVAGNATTSSVEK